MWIRCFWPLYVYSNDRVPARGCRMKVCNRGPQMLVTTAGAFTAFSLMTIAVGTDYWLYSRGVCRTKSVNDNDTNRKNEEVLTHSGLWRQCCMEGTFIGVCKNIDHFLEDADYEQDAAEYLLRAVRASSLFPILSVGLLFIGGVCVAASEFYKSRHNIILSAGIFFVSAGLSNIIGIIVYISSNAGDPNQSESKRSHWYGWSFYCGALSFIIAETVGVLTVHLFIDTHRVLRAQSNRSLRPSTHSSLQHRRSTSYRSRYRWKQGQNRSSDTRSREPSPTRYGNDLGLYTLGRGLPPKATHTLAHNSVNSAGGFAHFHNSVIANNSFANPRVCSVKSERGLPHVQNSLCSEKGIAFANAHRENSVKPENGVVLSQNFKQNSVNPSKFPVHAQNSVSDIAHTQSVLSSTATRRTTPV
ncbi:voltage-dependent calcium channel gamma-3 subunit isoform X1 [Xyrauchen texanus]|uniref:voltage-dependent calcium channel gamma-3 subunit isoform X1 n=1 Tax=Xyrauchen texanus TaxID=154827 RepID=UPI002241EB66|nr:voltage-dependent calcium channel gamma-3 subunit isoform X1 [Xyrauchen texanus]